MPVAKAAAEGAAIDAAGGGPEDPVADVAAAANAVRVSRPRSSGGGGTAFDRLPSGGQSGGLGVGVRLIWAAASGLLVLELLSLATGRFWTWNLKGGLSSLAGAGSYLGLYPGQTAKLASEGAPQNALTFTGTSPTQSSSTNLSGRAGGNLAAP